MVRTAASCNRMRTAESCDRLACGVTAIPILRFPRVDLRSCMCKVMRLCRPFGHPSAKNTSPWQLPRLCSTRIRRGNDCPMLSARGMRDTSRHLGAARIVTAFLDITYNGIYNERKVMDEAQNSFPDSHPPCPAARQTCGRMSGHLVGVSLPRRGVYAVRCAPPYCWRGGERLASRWHQPEAQVRAKPNYPNKPTKHHLCGHIQYYCSDDLGEHEPVDVFVVDHIISR